MVLDTETAAPRGAPHLVELGAVRVEDGEIAAHFETLVRPEVPVDPEAFAVHGIDDAALRDAPDAGEALAAFFDFAGDAWLAAHDAPQDAYALAFECLRHGIDAPAAPVLDTLALARRAFPESPDHRLETLAQVLDLDVLEHHRALPDAVTCWKVLEACLARLEAPGLAALLAQSRRLVTLASAGPPAPRVPQRLRALERAVRERGSVTLLYGDEDEAPVPLRVAPRVLYKSSDRGYVEGECLSSGSLKTYRLDRIRKVLAE